ncbi:hypothetical protein COOONC_03034 [Cooperia oncophora]
MGRALPSTNHGLGEDPCTLGIEHTPEGETMRDEIHRSVARNKNRLVCMEDAFELIATDEMEYEYSGSDDEEPNPIEPSSHRDDSEAASMMPADSSTLRKGFQRIQEASREAFEHAGAQQLKRIVPNERLPTASPHHHVYR